MYKTPILFIIFNRPTTALQVFERIRQQKPAQLFIASDGPRPGKNEEEIVLELRENILKKVDWECDVHTLFRDVNLGCGKGPANAISWFFQHVEKGIIIEDDVLPDPSFFFFMQAMLDRYEQENDVLHITGQNFQFGRKRGNGSYYFSSFPLIWGWATWRRAWELFDFDLKSIDYADIKDMPKGYIDAYNYMTSGKRDIWDYQWTFAVWKNRGKCIVPSVNLIQNMGFGEGATHTHQPPWWYEKLNHGSISSIIHPKSKAINKKADLRYINLIVNGEYPVYSREYMKAFINKLKGKIHAIWR